MLGCHLQSSADVAGYEFAGVLACSLVRVFVVGVMQEQVVAHSRTDETLLYLRQGIDGVVDIEQG